MCSRAWRQSGPAALIPHPPRAAARRWCAAGCARGTAGSAPWPGSARARPAISAVVKPPNTCSTSGSRYSSGNCMMARRRSSSPASSSLASAGSPSASTASTSTGGRRLRSYSRACSRRTMVNSHGRAAAGSLSSSRDFQALMSVSCTTSSATDRSRASQKANRSRSGRNISSSRVKAAVAVVPREAGFMYKTRRMGCLFQPFFPQ